MKKGRSFDILLILSGSVHVGLGNLLFFSLPNSWNSKDEKETREAALAGRVSTTIEHRLISDYLFSLTEKHTVHAQLREVHRLHLLRHKQLHVPVRSG